MGGRIWTLIRAELPETPEDWAPWAVIFESHGVDGTVQTDLPPTIGGYVVDPSLIGPISEDLTGAGAIRIDTINVPEEDWANAWKNFFVTRRIGQNLVIRPEWEPQNLQPGEVEIVLNPGQAFGTGDHATTRGCLVFLEKYGCAGKEIADIGGGSGILSVAAVKLGAKSVDAVDNDPVAVSAATENAERNGVTYTSLEGLGFGPLGDATYDLVVSNIISAALIRLAPEAANRVRPGGEWIVSGIIQSNWGDVRAAAEKVGFTYLEHRQEGDWIAAVFRR